MSQKDIVSSGNDFEIEQVDRAYLGARQSVVKVDGATGNVVLGNALTVYPGGKTSKAARADVIADPGDTGAIPVTKSGAAGLTSAAAETRTVAAPTFVGQTLCLVMDVDGGDITVTVATAVNQAGNNTLTFGAIRDFIKLEGILYAGDLVWQIVANDGVALSTV